VLDDGRTGVRIGDRSLSGRQIATLPSAHGHPVSISLEGSLLETVDDVGQMVARTVEVEMAVPRSMPAGW
jgi:hypothetical protein